MFTAALIAAGLLFVAAVLPLPLYLIAPGSAVDLSQAVRIEGRGKPRDHFFLTDVRLIRASPLRLMYALAPGVTIARAETVIPHGVASPAFENVMQSAMTESQAIAAVVAERAAGLRVALPPVSVEVQGIDDASPSRGVLAIGDVIRGVDRRAVRGTADIRAAISPLSPGTVVRIAVERAGRARTFAVRTILMQGRSRLGILLGEHYGPVRLAVPVRFEIGAVGGSSGGLMMALRIYDGLRGGPPGSSRSFAGTGTIALDGRVGPIEGTRQKLIAAKRAGARIFFVPRENYRDIAGESDVKIVPVDTFAQAVRALDERLRT